MRVYPTADRPDPRLRPALLADIEALYDHTAQHKQGTLLFLAGDSGNGRSATLSALSERFTTKRPRPVILLTDAARGSKTTMPSPLLAELIGQILPLAATFTDPITSGVFNFVGQLLQASASAHSLAETIAQRRDFQGDLDPSVITRLLRRAALDKPVICLLDHLDHLNGSWWHTLIDRFAPDIAHLPLLFVITTEGPAAVPQPTEATPRLLQIAHRLCAQQGIAHWRHLAPLTLEETAAWVGRAEPDLPATLHAVTAGNPAWLQSLWQDWGERRLIQADFDTLTWRLALPFTPQPFDAVKLIFHSRLEQLLPDDPAAQEYAQQILAIAALEGPQFTPDAIAHVLGQDADTLLDFLDTLLHEADRPTGLVQETQPLTTQNPGSGAQHKLYRYRFSADLIWRTLHHYGLTPTERRQRSGQLADALLALYQPQQATIARLLAQLYRTAGNEDQARHFQHLADTDAPTAILRAQVLYLLPILTADRQGWDTFDYRNAIELLLHAGNAMLDAYPYSETWRVFRVAYDLATELPLESAVARALYGQGQTFLGSSQYSQALTLFEQARSRFQTLRNRSSECSCLGSLGNVYLGLGDYPQALHYYQQALASAQEIGNRKGIGTWLGNLGSIYLSLGDYPQALHYYQQALTIAQETGNRSGAGACLGNLGSIYLSLSDYPQAIQYYQQALAIAQETGDRSSEGDWLGNLGIVYLSLGDYSQAIQYLQQALAIAQEIGDNEGESARLGNLGRAFHHLGDYPQAIQYYQQALVIAQEIGDRSSEGDWLGNLGAVYRSLGDYPQAIQHLQQALVIAQRLGRREGEGAWLSNLGGVYYHLGDYSQAIQYLQQALAIAQEIGNRYGEGTCLDTLGTVYHHLGDYPQAIQYFQQALAILENIGAPTASLRQRLDTLNATYRQ